MPQNVRTDRIFVRFGRIFNKDGSAWLGIESTDGKVLPCAADSLFRPHLRKDLRHGDAVRIAERLNVEIESFGQSRIMAPQELVQSVSDPHGLAYAAGAYTRCAIFANGN